MKHKLIRSIILIAIGIYAYSLAKECGSLEELDFTNIQRYGGDAYTGIQNAAAKTSNNVAELAKVVNLGFSSVLRIIALVLIGIGIPDVIVFASEKWKNALIDEEQDTPQNNAQK